VPRPRFSQQAVATIIFILDTESVGRGCSADDDGVQGGGWSSPLLTMVPACSVWSRTLRAASRWPSAILEQPCARRRGHAQVGTKEQVLSGRTKEQVSLVGGLVMP